MTKGPERFCRAPVSALLVKLLLQQWPAAVLGRPGAVFASTPQRWTQTHVIVLLIVLSVPAILDFPRQPHEPSAEVSDSVRPPGRGLARERVNSRVNSP